MSLNRNQERAVAVRLRMLEERLAIIVRLMDDDERGRLYRRDRAPYSAEQRARIDSVILEIRAEIAHVADTFGLASEEQDAARRIVGLLGITWEGLGDVRAGRLRGLGDVDPALPERLNPSVERLMDLVLDLQTIASRATDPHAGGQ
jgi:hypothetical protein